MASGWGRTIQQLRSQRKELQKQVEQISAAINALKELGGTGLRATRQGRKLGREAKVDRKRRRFSAATRRRMAAAQKARWAKVKKGKAQ